MRTTISLLLLGAALAAQAPPPSPTFADPVRLEAGGKLLGENRLFPSPVFQDMNGDGREIGRASCRERVCLGV